MAIYDGYTMLAGNGGSGGGSSTISCKFSETAISGIVEANNGNINNLLTANNENINNLLTANNGNINNLLTANNGNINNLLTANNDTISTMVSSVVDTSLTQRNFMPMIGGGNIRVNTKSFLSTLTCDSLVILYTKRVVGTSKECFLNVNDTEIVRICQSYTTDMTLPNGPFSVAIKKGSTITWNSGSDGTTESPCFRCVICDI